MSNDVSFGGSLFIQCLLFIVHYGEWVTLPWFALWFPTIFNVVLILIFLSLLFLAWACGEL